MGPWLTAFAYGTSYFSAVVFVGSRAVWLEIRTRFWDRNRKRTDRQSSCLGRVGAQDKSHDAAFRREDNAGFLECALTARH